jgi:hypothetical protein
MSIGDPIKLGYQEIEIVLTITLCCKGRCSDGFNEISFEIFVSLPFYNYKIYAFSTKLKLKFNRYSLETFTIGATSKK